MSVTRQVPLKQATLSLLSLVGGVSLAAIPAATLSIATRTFTAPDQGTVSVTLTAATFIGQLAFAVLIESRLSSARSERRVTYPRWLALLSVVASLAVAIFPTNPVVLCVALPALIASLEVGRGVSVAERLDAREAWAAVCVALGALGGVAVAFLGGDWGFVPLVAGITAATVIRSLPVSHRASIPEPSVIGWVVTDVAITGIIYPVLNTFILLFIGPIPAVLFAAISTVSGLLAIPLNFMRVRLLKAHSSLDVGISGVAVGVATLAIAVLEFTGVLGFIFHGSWTIAATIVPLAIACLWRAGSLLTTLPFAALRRLGHVRLLAALRAGCAIATFGAGLAVLPLHSLTAVFIVMLLGELAQAATYEFARRRVLARGSSGAR
jgi:hypothetical protein